MVEINSSLLVIILSSTVASSIVIAIKEVILWVLNRRANVLDKKEEDEMNEFEVLVGELADKVNDTNTTSSKLLEQIEVLKHKIDISLLSNKVVLSDRIRYLALRYIKEGEVSFEDRKIIHAMWDLYHDKEINGNGDLDHVMELLDELPLIITK